MQGVVSYQIGHARSARESIRPSLWNGLCGAWVPALGFTGNVLRDLTGVWGDAANVASPTWTPTVNGYAATYDGSTQYHTVAVPSSFAALTELSWGVWVQMGTRVDTDSNYYAAAIGDDRGSGFISGAIGLEFYQNDHPVVLFNEGGYPEWSYYMSASYWSATPRFLMGVWRASEDSGLMRVFVDGIEIPSYESSAARTTAWTPPAGVPLTIGSDYALRYPCNGKILANYIWTRKLTTAEILAVGTDPLCVIRPRRRLVVRSVAGTNYTETIADSLGLTDSASRVGGFSRSQADSLGLADVATRLAEWVRSQADGEGLSDAVAALAAFVRATADSEGLADATTRAADFARTQADSEGLTDYEAAAAEFVRALADSEGLTDAHSVIADYLRTVADSAGLVDALARVSEYFVSLADGEGLSDATARVADFSRAILDGEGLTDSAARVAALCRSVADAEGLTDATTKLSTFLRAIADDLGLTDEVVDVLTAAGFLAAWYVALRRNMS